MKESSTSLLIMLPSLLILSGCAPEREYRVPSSDNVSISYSVQGEGKPALVFVHGWSCDKSYWRFQVPYFAKRHRVVTIDLAGHGKSGLDRKAWTMEAFGADVAAVVKKLDLKQVVLVGHSMGADVIVEAVQQIPERVIGLVAVDAFRSLKMRLSPQQIEQFIAPFRADFAGTTDRFVRRLFGPASEHALVQETATDMSQAPREVALASMEALHKWRSEQLVEAVGKVTVPIVAINSDMRPSDVQSFESTFSSFKFVIMSGVGHFAMLEDPKTFNRLLAETINELSR
ncbi:MAG: alpha/beta fold hydrolase [Planctomycetota bacterium]